MELTINVRIRKEIGWSYDPLADVDERITAEPDRLLHAIDWGHIITDMVTKAVNEALAQQKAEDEEPDDAEA